MKDRTEKKDLTKIITSILEDKEYMTSFVFFVNRIENINVSIDTIQDILQMYLDVTRNIPVKGKNKISYLEDRYILNDFNTIGFIDSVKIEIIAEAVLKNTKVSLPITIHDFKRKYRKFILKNDKRLESYQNLFRMYQEGDMILEEVFPSEREKQVCGKSLIILKRNGKDTAIIIKDYQERKSLC